MPRHISQALVIIRSAWVRQLNFRFTIWAYRVGEMAEVLVLILMWSAIYAGGGGIIKGFSLNEMITYVLVGNFVAAIIRNFLPSGVSRDINEGRLSMYLVKPISYIKYTFINEIGRAGFITLAAIGTQGLMILFFLDRVVLNTDWRYIVLIALMVFFAFIIEMLLGFLVGTIAFWTEEVEGIQSTIDRIKRFFSGGYFPLSLLPVALATVSTYLPFAYSFFVPAQLYLKKIDLQAGIVGLGIQLIWIILLSIIVSVVWKEGLKRYEATGS